MADVRTGPTRLYHGVIVLLALTASGCGDGDPAGPAAETVASLTVDAVADWTLVDLADPAREVQATDPTASAVWDLAFFGTGVMLNGGAAGPGEVQGYCICQNAGATDQQILDMTADSELAAFEAVTAASIPADAEAWQNDSLVPAIDGWWSYDVTTHTVTPVTDRAWIIRTAEGDAFVKLRVAGIANATLQHAGQVTLEFARQPGPGQPYGETRSLTVDLAAGPAYVDLLQAAVVDESDWDLRLEGYEITLNGGVSGGGAAAAAEAGTTFENAPGGIEMSSHAFAQDAYGGVFEASPWYRYDLQGNHQVWPNFNVYLIRTGDEVYKVQLTSYYNPANGAARHITFRYAPLAD